MDKVGAVVDRATLQSLFEQMSALHAGALADRDQKVANRLDFLQKILTDLLQLTVDKKYRKNTNSISLIERKRTEAGVKTLSESNFIKLKQAESELPLGLDELFL